MSLMSTDVPRDEQSQGDAVGSSQVSQASQAIGPYLRSVRRHWVLVLIVTLLAGAVAGFTLYRSNPSYQANASILVTPLPEGDPNFLGIGVVLDTGDPARTVQTAAALVDSTQAAAATAKAMGHGWTTSRVQQAVNVTPEGQSNVLSVTASSTSRSEAAKLANSFARSALQYRATIVQHNIASELSALQSRVAALSNGSPGSSSQVNDISARIGELRSAQTNGGDPSLSISQPAQVPSSPSGAPRWLIVLLAVIGGFAVASVAALGLDFFSRPLRDEDELGSLFPAPILATIPRVRHRGSVPLSPSRFTPAAFEQVRMLRVQLELGVQAPVIMVTSAGAGDGKTTLVAALAATFSESGKRVIVMDLDFRKPNLARVLGVELPEPGPLSDEKPNEALVPVPHLPNVKLLPLPTGGPATVDAVMVRLPLLLAQAQRVVDCVILDTAPVGEVSEALRIAPMSETVVFVARPRHTDRRRLILARDLMHRAGVRVAGLVLVGQALPGGGYGGYHGYTETEPGGAIAEPVEVEPPAGVASGKRRSRA
jgi:Mrp family chromosome partitioning ATPase/carbon monoxide dehydrogenase subunit G